MLQAGLDEGQITYGSWMLGVNVQPPPCISVHLSHQDMDSLLSERFQVLTKDTLCGVPYRLVAFTQQSDPGAAGDIGHFTVCFRTTTMPWHVYDDLRPGGVMSPVVIKTSVPKWLVKQSELFAYVRAIPTATAACPFPELGILPPACWSRSPEYEAMLQDIWDRPVSQENKEVGSINGCLHSSLGTVSNVPLTVNDMRTLQGNTFVSDSVLTAFLACVGSMCVAATPVVGFSIYDPQCLSMLCQEDRPRYYRAWKSLGTTFIQDTGHGTRDTGHGTRDTVSRIEGILCEKCTFPGNTGE